MSSDPLELERLQRVCTEFFIKNAPELGKAIAQHIEALIEADLAQRAAAAAGVGKPPGKGH
jgi:hypothetical protein